jgi:hypothetical protein
MAAPTQALRREESTCQLGAVHTMACLSPPYSLSSFNCAGSRETLLLLLFEETRAHEPVAQCWGEIVEVRRMARQVLTDHVVDVETKWVSAL